MQKKSFFIIEKMKKYRKCPALDKSQREMEIKKIQITLPSELRGLVTAANVFLWFIIHNLDSTWCDAKPFHKNRSISFHTDDCPAKQIMNQNVKMVEHFQCFDFFYIISRSIFSVSSQFELMKTAAGSPSFHVVAAASKAAQSLSSRSNLP